MAKKKPTSRTDAVRQAVDQAFQTQIPRERISELLDELGNTAGRLRGAVDELRPASVEERQDAARGSGGARARVAALEGEARGQAQAGRAPARRQAPAAATSAARRKPRRDAAGEGQAAGRGVLMGAEFKSDAEFREPMDRVFTLMSEDPDMGPKLRDADVPQRWEFEDLDLIVNIRAATDDEGGNLHWEWSDDVDWKSKVQMRMSSETANKYFQGKENVPVAIARRRIKTGGDIKAALALIPITKPVYAQYRAVHRGRAPAPRRLTRARGAMCRED